MSDEIIKKEDLFNVIKHGHAWHAEKIKEQLGKLMVMSLNQFNHDFRYDNENSYFFIYDNDCTLVIFDGKIEMRSDRDNVFSADETFTYVIKNEHEIFTAYEHFKSLLMEDEGADEGD